jgi:hypothetical protein
MCTLVFTDDETIRSVAELRYLLGSKNIVSKTEEPLSPSECLCWVDVPASAEKAGYVAEHDDFGYRLRKK